MNEVPQQKLELEYRVMNQIDFADFLRIDIRVGTIVKVEAFERAKNPSYKIWVDFGKNIGIKKTSAQVTFHYLSDDLIGRQVC
jgi:tRNA-binding protein